MAMNIEQQSRFTFPMTHETEEMVRRDARSHAARCTSVATRQVQACDQLAVINAPEGFVERQKQLWGTLARCWDKEWVFWDAKH